MDLEGVASGPRIFPPVVHGRYPKAKLAGTAPDGLRIGSRHGADLAAGAFQAFRRLGWRSSCYPEAARRTDVVLPQTGMGEEFSPVTIGKTVYRSKYHSRLFQAGTDYPLVEFAYVISVQEFLNWHPKTFLNLFDLHGNLSA